jgi:hypothetical protein
MLGILQRRGRKPKGRTKSLVWDHNRPGSLAETGRRVLRHLEVEHDGFRSDRGRETFLRISQAVKYLGWPVQPKGSITSYVADCRFRATAQRKSLF